MVPTMSDNTAITIITPTHEHWPAGLADLDEDMPQQLWVRGDTAALTMPAVTYTGARARTSYGEFAVSDLARGTVKTNRAVVAGLAYGIEGAAHRATLSVGGVTVAYLAGGVDRPYPLGHLDLMERIITSGGAVVSPYEPGSVPTRHRFLKRTQLIAAHSAALVIVEAAGRSGSLNATRTAARIGRPVGAVPGQIDSVTSMGSLSLLADGTARLIRNTADVLRMLPEHAPV